MTRKKKRTPQKNLSSPVSPDPELFRMLATSQNDYLIPNYGDILRPQDETLLHKGGSKGIRLYEEVKKDGHAFSVLSKRSLKVVSRDWMLQSASEDPRDIQASELVERAIRRLPFDQICNDLLDADLFGFAASEIEWEVSGSEILPKTIDAVRQDRIVFDMDWQPRLLTRENFLNGIVLPERKWIIHRVGDKGSDPYGSGLGRILFWHVLFKREGVGFWAKFLSKFASPTPVARYPMGTPPSEQDRLLQHLLYMVQCGALVVPIGTDVSFLESASQGAVSYKEWCDYWDKQTTITVLGETLSTDLGSVGSNAAAVTHDGVSDMIADASSDLLSATLNETVVRWIVEFNLPGANPPTLWRPRPKNEVALEDLKTKRADRQKKELDNLFDLANKGYQPMDGIESALSEIMGVTVVTNNSLSGVRNNLLSGSSLTPSFADHPHDHGVSDLADQVSGEVESFINKLVHGYQKKLNEVQTLDEFRDHLLTSYSDPEFSIDPVGNILGDVFAVAELTGRSDVKDEIK